MWYKVKHKVSKLLIVIITIILLIVILTSFYLYFYFHINKKINKFITKEYGEKVSLSDLTSDGNLNITCNTDLNLINDIGEYKVLVKYSLFTYSIIIKIVDTTAPIVTTQDLQIYLDEDLPKSSDFITNIEDLSECSIEPITITKVVGLQVVNITVKDSFNNKTTVEAKLNIIEDKEPPVFSGLSPITIYVGQKADLYIGVSAVDKRFGNTTFTVDDSKVNYNVAGTYEIYYEASDKLGNKATEKRTIKIIKPYITPVKPTNNRYEITNFPTYNQKPDYPNGCEIVALYNLLRFYNISVSLDTLVNDLPKGDYPYLENDILYGGNPEIEYVGEPNGTYGYGVYQKPILEVANKYKSGMIDYTGHSLNDVLSLVSKGIPVQVWVSINLINSEIYNTWIYKPTNETITWLGDLHSVVVMGFTSDTVLVSDSFYGNIKEYDYTQFNKIYNLFGKRALYYPN